MPREAMERSEVPHFVFGIDPKRPNELSQVVAGQEPEGFQVWKKEDVHISEESCRNIMNALLGTSFDDRSSS